MGIPLWDIELNNMRCEEIFEETYRKAPDDVAFCPYRICPIGAHVDHQLGRITGLAIDRGIYFAYSSKQNGVIELLEGLND